IILDVFWSFGVIVENVFSRPDTGYADENGMHFCEGDYIVFTVLGPYSANVQWYKDDVLLDGETNASLTVYEGGFYHAVCATATCPEDYSYSLVMGAIVEECNTASTKLNEFESSIQLFPIPTKDVVYISNKNNVLINKYEIFSITGKKLHS